MSKQSDDKNENSRSKKDVASPADAASSKDKDVKGKGETSKPVEPQAVAKDSHSKTGALERDSAKPDADKGNSVGQDAKAGAGKSPNEKSGTEKVESAATSEKSNKNQTAEKAVKGEVLAPPAQPGAAETKDKVQIDENVKVVQNESSETKNSETKTEKSLAKTETSKPEASKAEVSKPAAASGLSKSSDNVDDGVKEKNESKNKDAVHDKDALLNKVAVEKKDASLNKAVSLNKDAVQSSDTLPTKDVSQNKDDIELEAKNSIPADSGHVKSAIKDELSRKRDLATQEVSARQSTAQGDTVSKEQEVSIKDLEPFIEKVDDDPEDSGALTPVPAQNIFPENMPVRNIAGLLDPTMPPTGDKVETYATVAAAAEQSHYDSAQDVISSVQSILKPKGEFLSRAELLEASKQLKKVMPYNFEAWRLHADILLNALRQLETRQLLPDDSFQILAIPLRENDIRDAAESALRQCAHFAPNEHQRIRLVDEANSVRRITLF